MIITKGGSNKAQIKDLEPGTIFSLSTGSVCLVVTRTSLGHHPAKQIIILRGDYDVQGFCAEEEVTVHYGAELILR